MTSRTVPVPSGRLWFGVAASAVAWLSLGVADILLTWAACLHQEQFGGASNHSAVWLLAVFTTAVLFAVVLTSGTVSYRNWKEISGDTRLEGSEGDGREEFMALLGVFVSFTLGVGVVWLALPLFMLDLCVRTR